MKMWKIILPVAALLLISGTVNAQSGEEEDRKAMEEFGKFFEGEEGQKLVEELRNATDEERYRKLNALLREAVAKGMPEEKAKLFGQSVAMELGDALQMGMTLRTLGSQS